MTEAQDKRWLPVAAVVLLTHAAALYALQAGMLRLPAQDIELPRIISATVLMAAAEPSEPAPQPDKPKPPKPAPQAVPSKPVVRPLKPDITPRNVAVAPAPMVTSASAESNQAVSDVAASTGEPSDKPAPSSTPAPVVELPSKAAYLNNPKPTYPAISKRLGEEGTVKINVLIGADGLAKEVRLSRSSGFERLDDAALTAVKQWRFVPGKRNGVAEAMWFDVPVRFELD